MLDVGCGSGEFLALAESRGARVSGIDASGGMIAAARGRLADADLRVGASEQLPWGDDRFDVVTAFNSLQFAADFLTALSECARVARPGGRVAVCNWGPPDRNDLARVFEPLRRFDPPPDPGAPAQPAVREPGVLEGLAAQAGLRAERSGVVAVPYEPPDRRELFEALVVSAGLSGAPEAKTRPVVEQAVDELAIRYRRPDGSYRFENQFRYVVATA